MPLVPSQIALNIRSSSAIPPTIGWVPLTEAIGLGVFSWCTANPVNLLILGAAAGTLGAGIVNGKLVVPPAPPLVIGSFAAAGIIGVKAAEVATAIAVGVSMTFTQSGLYMGPAAGVSLGPDVAKIVSANGPALGGQIHGYFAAMGITGIYSGQLAQAIGNGIALNTMLGFGTGVVAPAGAGPAPGVGTTPSSMVV
jgi:hypothetical protein